MRPVFDTLPKMHKSKVEPVPGCPIVAGNQSLTKLLTIYINSHIVQQLPFYVKDTVHISHKFHLSSNFLKLIHSALWILSTYTQTSPKRGLRSADILSEQERNLYTLHRLPDKFDQISVEQELFLIQKFHLQSLPLNFYYIAAQNQFPF